MKSKIYLLSTGLSKNDKFFRTPDTIAECTAAGSQLLLFAFEKDLIFDDNLREINTPPIPPTATVSDISDCDCILIEEYTPDGGKSKFDFYKVNGISRHNSSNVPATATYTLTVEYDHFVNTALNVDISATFNRAHLPYKKYCQNMTDAGGVPGNRTVERLNTPETGENGRCDCLAVFTTGKMRVVQGEGAADDITTNPRSDGVGVFFIPLDNAPAEYASTLSFSGFYEEFYYNLLGAKIYPLQSPDILGILPCKIRDLPVGWRTVEYGDVRYGDNPVKSMAIFTHSQTDSGLLFSEKVIYPTAYATCSSVVKNTAQQVTASLWGADFPLSVKKMMNTPVDGASSGWCRLNYAVMYDGGFTVSAVIEYPGGVTEFRRAACTVGMLSIKSDRYTEQLVNNPAQYYSGLLVGGIGGVGAVVGNIAAGNVFGAVQGAASLAGQAAAQIDLRNAPDSVKGGSDYIERWEFGDHLVKIDIYGEDETGKVDGYAGIFPYVGAVSMIAPGFGNPIYEHFTAFQGAVKVSSPLPDDVRDYIARVFAGGVRMYNSIEKCRQGVIALAGTNEVIPS